LRKVKHTPTEKEQLKEVSVLVMSALINLFKKRNMITRRMFQTQVENAQKLVKIKYEKKV